MASNILNDAGVFLWKQAKPIAEDYQATFMKRDGTKNVLQKAGEHAKVGGIAAGVFAFLGYELAQIGTLGILIGAPFLATCIPLGFISYNVWAISRNASQPGAFDGSRLEKETRLMKGTKHFGWAVDMILDIDAKKTGHVRKANNNDAEVKKDQMKALLDTARKTAFAAEMCSVGLFVFGYALSNAVFPLSLVGTIAYITAPIFSLLSYGVYKLTDSSHTSIETVENKYPNGVPEFSVLMKDLTSDAFSSATLVSIYKDCMRTLGLAPQPA